MTTGSFPATRFRRTKSSDAMRRLVRETSLSVDDLIWPIFLREGEDDETPVASMLGLLCGLDSSIDGQPRDAGHGRHRGFIVLTLAQKGDPETVVGRLGLKRSIGSTNACKESHSLHSIRGWGAL